MNQRQVLHSLKSLLNPRSIVAFLAIYGILCFLIYFKTHGYTGLEHIMGTRLYNMNMAFDSIYQGRSLLLGINEQGKYFPVGFSDDRGMYIFVPIFAKLLGIADPVTGYALFQKAMLFPLIAVYPVALYFIFRSMIISLLSPWIITTFFVVFKDFSDSYWIQQWILLISIPIMWAILKLRWHKHFYFLVFIVGFAASVSNSIRSFSGLGVVLSLVGILLYRMGWKRAVKVSIPILLVAYVSVSPLLVNAVIAHRDSVTKGVDMIKDGASHPFFHSAYIGIANGQPNKYGILYNDEYGTREVQKINPHAPYLSDEYNRTMSQLYFGLLKKDPAFFLSNYWNKASILIKYFFMSAMFTSVLLLLLFIGRTQKLILEEKKFYIGANISLVIPLLLGALPGVLTIIGTREGVYTLGYLGASVWFWLLWLFYAIKLVEKRLTSNKVT